MLSKFSCVKVRCIKIMALEHRFKIIQNEIKKGKDNKRKPDEDDTKEKDKEPKEPKKAPKKKQKKGAEKNK